MNWIKKNYGGEPTKNKDLKRAIFIGRFQPYHYGHIKLIEQKINAGIPILILVRDINVDESNPLTTDETIYMINKYHVSMNHDVVVMKIPDIESVNFGRGVGYEVNEYVPPKDIEMISATQIRKDIRSDSDNWKLSTPEILHQVLYNKLS